MADRSAPRPFPPRRLKEVLRLPQTLRDANAGKPMNRILLASALKMSPSSSSLRDMIMSSYRYGMTEGSYNSDTISLTALGESITAPRSDAERRNGLRTAMLNVPVFEKLVGHFSNARLPEASFLKNTLERAPFEVDTAWSGAVASAFREDAAFLGILKQVGDGDYLVLDQATVTAPGLLPASERPGESDPGTDDDENPEPMPSGPGGQSVRRETALRNNRVFISHGKNRAIVEQIKEIVLFGRFEPVVSVESVALSKPVPDKVLDDMRSCFAGVIHVAADDVVVGEDAKPRRLINQNVLIEIGAAMALYRKNFILLVEEGTDLPTNLQGLYETRYSGQTLDGAATMKLLKTFNEFGSPE